MENKEIKLDNKEINSKYKSELNRCDDFISDQKKELGKLDVEQEVIVSLHQNIEECFQIISESVKGSSNTKSNEAIREQNMINMKKSLASIDERRRATNESINKVYNEKDNIEKKIKEDNVKEDDKE